MIVWSKGLGKQRLPLALADATLHVKPTLLQMEGVIEPVCWDYAIKLGPDDLRDFLKLMARRDTAALLAERGGILLPFVGRLLAVAPGLVIGLIAHQVAALFHKEAKP